MTVQRKKWVKPAILSAVLLTAGGLGVAAANSGGWGHGDCEARHGRGGMSGMFMPGRHIDGKLAFLKTELKITGEQEAAWQAFADVVRKNEQERTEKWQAHRERRREMRDDEDKSRDAPALNERIDRGLEAMEQRMAAFRKMGEAAKTLYGELTPEQQELADGMLSHRHGRRFMF